MRTESHCAWTWNVCWVKRGKNNSKKILFKANRKKRIKKNFNDLQSLMEAFFPGTGWDICLNDMWRKIAMWSMWWCACISVLCHYNGFNVEEFCSLRTWVNVSLCSFVVREREREMDREESREAFMSETWFYMFMQVQWLKTKQKGFEQRGLVESNDMHRGWHLIKPFN